MVRLLPVTFALSWLLLAISSAAAPPAFPGGTEVTVTFTDYGTGLALGNSRIELTFAGQQIPAISARTLANGSATIYLQQAVTPLIAVASMDEPATPELDYISPQIELSNGTNIEMVPVGTVSGTVSAENGTAAQATVTFDCANKALSAPAVTADANGRFSAALPAGQCLLSASAQGMTGNATVTVRKGESSQADILLSAQGGQLSLPSSPGAQFASFVLVLAVLVVAAFIVYYFLSKKPSPKKRRRKGGGRLKLIPLLLLLAILLPVSRAASLSNNIAAANHTYDLLSSLGYVPVISSLAVSGTAGSSDGCAGTVAVEISDNGQSYAEIGSAETVSPQNFSLSFPNPGAHRYIRIMNVECGLAGTSLQISEKPDITISSLRISGEPKTGIPINLTATVYNAGGSLPAGQPAAILLAFYDSAVDPQHLIGEVQLNSSEAAWGERGSTEKSVVWIPPLLGTRTLYATAYLSPASPGLEVDEGNNMASLGIFIQAGPGENRATTLEVAVSPSSLESGQAAPIHITATYRDFLTAQPILGANCSASEAGQPGPNVTQESESGYYWERGNQSWPVGVYEFSATCEKSGYAPANGTTFLPVNSWGGQQVLLQREEEDFKGTILTDKRSLGPMAKLKVRVERAGPETMGFAADSVKINGRTAASIESDATQRNSRYWLEPGATFVEWTFEMDRIPIDSLTISFETEVAPAHATAIAVSLTPVRAACVRAQPAVEILPRDRAGEVGTPLFYQVVVTNNDGRECPPTEFSMLAAGLRTGWGYSFSSSRLIVSPGKSNITFVSVEPPLGEQPGSYNFKVEVADPDVHTGPQFGAPPQAEAAYNVTSPKLFAGLEAGLLGNSTMPAGPRAVFEFYARYYDITNSSIGSCIIITDLIGTKGVRMAPDGARFTLPLNFSSRSPGTYMYLIECEAAEHKPLAFTGNITIAAHATQMRYPSLSLAPAAQHASGNSTLAFIARTSNNEICNGTRQFLLRAQPPEGWAVELEGNAPRIQCGADADSLARITPPAGLPRGLYFIPVTASYSSGPGFTATSYALVASSQSQQRVLSCLSGDAEESAQNLELGGDPCSNWNAAHTYPLNATSGEIIFAGRTALENCSSTVEIEASTDSASFTKVAEVKANSSADFSVAINNTGYVRVRIADDKCRLARTALMYGPDSSGSPELSVAGADFPVLVQGSRAVVTASIRNSGQSTYSSYTAGIALRSPEGDTTPLDFKTLHSHASGSDQVVTFGFTPASAGTFDLVITADYANEINESDKSDNSLVIPVEILPAPQAIRASLSPGWNLVPFINGISPANGCNLSDAYAFDASSARAIPLNSSTLAFISDADFSNFTAAHGVSSSPRDAGAFGGAWAYSEGACDITYPLENASSQSRQAFSQLEVPQGDSLITILPWMAGNTPQNVMGACGSNTWEWDATQQRWAKHDADAPFSADDVGKVVLVRAAAACHLG